MKRQKLLTFFALWNEFARAAAQRDDRLMWCARQLGEAVDSMNDLSDEQLDMLTTELRRQLKQGTTSNVLGFTGKPMSPDRASKEQIWKIRQIEAYLGWRSTPERMSGFLRDKYRVDSAEMLTCRNAWRAIESLMGVAAQAEFDPRTQTGFDKRASIKRIKGVLKTWRGNAA